MYIGRGMMSRHSFRGSRAVKLKGLVVRSIEGRTETKMTYLNKGDFPD